MSADAEIRSLLLETATRLFTDRVDAATLDAAKREGWSETLWATMEQAELTRIGTPEEVGGAGGGLSDLAAVLRLAGRYAAPVPYVETALLANWLLCEAGLDLPRGPLAVIGGVALEAERAGQALLVSGIRRRTPWARIASCIVALARAEGEPFVVALDPRDCRIVAGRNLAGEPRDDLELARVAPIAVARAPAHVTPARLRERAALGRALLVAGACERALELAIDYARQRVQFGRPIAQSQAIQQELARAGGEVAAAVAAALSAAGALERSGEAMLEIAAARIRTAHAAGEVAAVSHQVHGAIGVTDEYALHHWTLRLWSWRDEDGNEAVWSAALGRALLAGSADDVWPLLTDTARLGEGGAGR